MENHPIPQDITGFQFKLIGDMTVKQFAYLAGGTIIAWIFFSLPITLFIKLPLSSIFVLFGISFSFLAIEGRPMDTMVLNFIRATFSPTKYIYQNPNLSVTFQATNPKSNEKIDFNPGVFHKVTTEAPKNELDKKEFDFFRMLSQIVHPSASSGSTPVKQASSADVSASAPYIVTAQVAGEKKPMPHAEQGSKEKQTKEGAEEPDLELEEQTRVLQEELKAAVEEEKEKEGSQNYEEAHKKVLEIENLLSETLASKQKLEKEIEVLKKQLEMQTKDVYTPSQAQVSQTPNVRTIANKAQGKSAGLPTSPEFPNIITGIVKDPRRNPLGNILVEVKDNSGNPVRAFKTNPLGQFQASTPLTNGTYTIEFEDPKGMNKFDIIKFQALGDIILPIEILSIDTREELRKELFNN